MRAVSLTLASALLTVVAAADEPKAPKNLVGPMNAYATAKLDGKKVAVTLKVVDAVPEVRVAKQTVFETVTKTMNGKTVTEQVPVEKVVQYTVFVGKGFREVKLVAAEVKARDTAGNPIMPRKLTELLATETPVLVSLSPEPLEPFHLINTKDGTVILHVDRQKIFPPNDGLPVVPAPKRESSAPALTKFLTGNKCSFDAEVLSSGAFVSVSAGGSAPAGQCRIVAAHLGDMTDAKLKAFADAASAPATVERVFITSSPGECTAAGLRDLCRVKSIRDFGCSLGNSGVKPADFACFGQLPDLTHFGVGDMAKAGDEILAVARDFKSIRNLGVNNCDVTDAGLSRVAEMNLDRLYVNSPHLTPAAWNTVAKLSNLTTLDLILCPKLTGGGLAKVKNLPLRSLTLRNAGVTDVDLPLVAGVPTLKEVRLPENAITDAGLQHLAGLKLTLLDVRQTKVTAAGVTKLAAALPGCRIEWDGGAVEPRK